jgi:hypothetical protein
MTSLEEASPEFQPYHHHPLTPPPEFQPGRNSLALDGLGTVIDEDGDEIPNGWVSWDLRSLVKKQIMLALFNNCPVMEHAVCCQQMAVPDSVTGFHPSLLERTPDCTVYVKAHYKPGEMFDLEKACAKRRHVCAFHSFQQGKSPTKQKSIAFNAEVGSTDEGNSGSNRLVVGIDECGYMSDDEDDNPIDEVTNQWNQCTANFRVSQVAGQCVLTAIDKALGRQGVDVRINAHDAQGRMVVGEAFIARMDLAIMTVNFAAVCMEGRARDMSSAYDMVENQHMIYYIDYPSNRHMHLRWNMLAAQGYRIKILRTKYAPAS